MYCCCAGSISNVYFWDIRQMKNIYLLVGLPSSSKTSIANQLKNKFGGTLIDDPKSFNDQIKPILDQNQDDIFYICDPHLCEKSILEKAINRLQSELDNCQIKLIFFENNPDQCRKNVAARNDGRRVNGTINRLSKIYNPDVVSREFSSYPSIILPVWSYGVIYNLDEIFNL
jgi:shikimate kinase